MLTTQSAIKYVKDFFSCEDMASYYGPVTIRFTKTDTLCDMIDVFFTVRTNEQYTFTVWVEDGELYGEW